MCLHVIIFVLFVGCFNLEGPAFRQHFLKAPVDVFFIEHTTRDFMLKWTSQRVFKHIWEGCTSTGYSSVDREVSLAANNCFRRWYKEPTYKYSEVSKNRRFQYRICSGPNASSIHPYNHQMIGIGSDIWDLIESSIKSIWLLTLLVVS